MRQVRSINVRQFIDERSVGRHQALVTALIFLVVAFDGMDVGIMGYVAPEIIRLWGISKPEMGMVLSAVFFGMAAGAVSAGPIGDRFGRRGVIVGSVLWFGATTLLAALSAGVTGLLILRILTGVGLGAAIPTGLALMAELAPERSRSLLLTIVFSGFTAGASVAGLFAAWLIPSYGWQATLAAAGLLPVIFALLLYLLLSESVAFLALKGQLSAIPRILRKIDPQAIFPDDAQFWIPVAPGEPKSSFVTLMSRRYWLATVMLCLAYFLGVLVTYVIVGWLPVVNREAGFTPAEGAIITALFTLAGPAGAMSLGVAMDRLSRHKTLVLTFLIASALLASVGIAPKTFAGLCGFMLALGFFFHGSMAGLQALAPQSFPTSARATGVSTMHAVGRLGAIGSGLMGAVMLGWGWGLPQIFVALAVPTAICGLAIAAIASQGRNSPDPVDGGRPAIARTH